MSPNYYNLNRTLIRSNLVIHHTIYKLQTFFIQKHNKLTLFPQYSITGLPDEAQVYNKLKMFFFLQLKAMGRVLTVLNHQIYVSTKERKGV
jgi:hypothetical protein